MIFSDMLSAEGTSPLRLENPPAEEAVDAGALKDDSWAVVQRMQAEAELAGGEPGAVVEIEPIRLI